MSRGCGARRARKGGSYCTATAAESAGCLPREVSCPSMSTLSRDLRYAIRALLANPGFTAVAVLSLAIGIGANTAIFSVTNALLLRPLPYKNADRQVILWNTSPGLGITEDWFSTAQYFDIRNGQQSFEDVAIAIGANANLTGDGDPERVGTIRVSSNLLPMLGARPLLGDLFGPDDDRPGKTGKALLGYGTWMRRYGGDRGVVGRSPHAQRSTARGRWRSTGVLLAATRGHADARRSRGCRSGPAAPYGRKRSRGPQSRGLQHHRHAEARRDGRAGASRARYPDRAPQTRAS